MKKKINQIFFRGQILTSRRDKKASLFVPNDRVQIEQDKICNLKMKHFLHMKFITQILDK